ncbi:MAG: nickel pincer cofactor biosynthesis protein LarB [Firmicutes bacterium]|nr:nickel pincer cofactor biosynthesis protein LarB [Bacillota bacterium]
MTRDELRKLLTDVSEGNIDVGDAVLKLKSAPFKDLGYAKPDCHRGVRQGAAEVIYGEGKTAEQIIGISKSLADEQRILITRLDSAKAEEIRKSLPLEYYENGRIGVIGGMSEDKAGKIIIAAGGTSDIPVAEEAALTAEFYGNNVLRLYDVGVSGIHRLLAYSEDIMSANVIAAVAGMEGALASVIGGLADCPVIAVPTSVGYGASFGGVAALLAMLNSCASGVSVVNIDNGFGAGYLASMINRAAEK